MHITKLLTLTAALLAGAAEASRHKKRPDFVNEKCWLECDDICWGGATTYAKLWKGKQQYSKCQTNCIVGLHFDSCKDLLTKKLPLPK
ncbi:hypothetical protein Cob_v009758 [Colletotrichum orbiculare MAFF 240422]|uniref:Uncharacterized protein n=1 Tax=Colletotrichum orbiculare (strain 104-T / ATCC 96160 / CBS 514.97 / LARS 414 / MAFF 240422) TaxID=1213857 RepID=N4VY71_COLOR|nr:hypothetical protein Cob_v009758 [Colletotrichum orbiculare MAFF 240422]